MATRKSRTPQGEAARIRRERTEVGLESQESPEAEYGLTLEAYEDLLASQGGGCAICGKPNPDNVDHDHVTGRVRGILCWNCNIAIGQLEDDSDRARAIAEYLDIDDDLGEVARDRLVALSG